MPDTNTPFKASPPESGTDADPFSLDLASGDVACGLVVAPAEPAAVLVLSPALGVHAAFYARFSRVLATAGIAVVLHEQRGHGASPVRAGRAHDWGYRELVEEELPAIVGHVRVRFPDLPLFMGGHSLGAQLACLAAGTMADDRPAGIVILASGVQHARLYRPLWRLGALTGAFLFPRAARWRGFHDGPRMGFGGREPIRLMQDWSRVVHTGRYHPDGTLLDYETALASLALPVLMLTFDRDDYAPRKSARGLAAKMPEARLTHLHWSSTELAGAPADHFGWTRRPDPVAHLVAGWIKLHAGL